MEPRSPTVQTRALRLKFVSSIQCASLRNKLIDLGLGYDSSEQTRGQMGPQAIEEIPDSQSFGGRWCAEANEQAQNEARQLGDSNMQTEMDTILEHQWFRSLKV